MGDASSERKSGCGILNAVFGRRSFWQRRTASTGSLPTANGIKFVKSPASAPRRRRSSTDEATFRDISASEVSQQIPITKAPTNPRNAPVQHHHQHHPPRQQHQNKNFGNLNHGRKPPDEGNKIPDRGQDYRNQNYGNPNQARKVPRGAIGVSGELESMIIDHQKSKGSGNLVRASSGNVMLFGNLGNLRQVGGGGGTGNTNSYNAMDYLPKTSREESAAPNGKYPNSVMGNVVMRKQDDEKPRAEQPGSLCRALSTRMDPEQLKIMGNEDYKNGNFAEALALYDAAISIDPNKASYRSNKSAALTALGRLLDAVFECREAIRIDPRYHRAHHRLANLYIRLGEAEKAMYHYKHAGPEADHVDMNKAKALHNHLCKCTEAKSRRDWNSLIKETKAAISSGGADSAPQIYALQAEALIKLRRHQEAEQALTKGPNFDAVACTKFFGPIYSANLSMVRAQVYLAIGRFDDALAAAQTATRLDSNNKEANTVMRKVRAVAAARSNGNQLFKLSKFYEACIAYGEGLEHDPYSSVLLCNRAACRSKLGQHEKAVEDCTVALNMRPNYSKARLRRADCYAKMEKWEASIQDYEILLKELPDDGNVRQGLMNARAQLKKQRS